jgi:SAM-dependent methyltransferase
MSESNKLPEYNAKQYVKYRPISPQALFDFLYSKITSFDTAWDCGCGNGQSAVELAKMFKRVIATDVSESQIEKAIPNENVEYRVASAEQTNIADHSLDLITVSQALHWFDHDAFAQEVRRVLKKAGVLAAWGYGYPEINPQVDQLITGFSRGPLDSYWAKGREYLENQYHDIPFPFEYERHDEFYSEKQFNFHDLMGWLSSWSAYLKYVKDNDVDILASIEPSLLEAWGDPNEVKVVKFPIYLLIGATPF